MRPQPPRRACRRLQCQRSKCGPLRFPVPWRGAARQLVTRGDQVTVGTMMALTLSIDHRVLDGAAFLADLKNLIEEPIRTVL